MTSVQESPATGAVSGRAATSAEEVAKGERFAFGKNWRAFLRSLDEERVEAATKSLQALLGMSDLSGLRFLDVGSGSGLSSLAAHRLGATVVSFDYDGDSVACTRTVCQRFREDDERWRVFQGSVLDGAFLQSLGQFDIVYSWGVLHHTGAMWPAIENCLPLVGPEGLFALAIYNDQGAWSRRWRLLKKFYCSGVVGRATMSGVYIPYRILRGFLTDLVWLRNPLSRYRVYKRQRGMSVLRDWVDWLGGYPFEVAKPEEIFRFLSGRGFELVNLTTCGGSVGCNEFVFRRRAHA